MGLQGFVEKEKKRLQDFEDWWLAKNKVFGNSFALTFEDERRWYDEYLIFRIHSNREEITA